MVVIFASAAVGLAVTSLRGLSPHGQLTELGLLVYFGIAGAIGIPGIFAYSFLMPSTARLGIMVDGVIIEATSSKYPHLGFRQGYRWAEVRLKGRSLILLPKVRPRAPRSLRLTAAQLERLAPRLVPP